MQMEMQQKQQNIIKMAHWFLLHQTINSQIIQVLKQYHQIPQQQPMNEEVTEV